MTWKSLGICALLLIVQPAHAASPTTSPAAQNPALQETSRSGWWMARHNAILERNKQGSVDLVFLGDSITQNYEKHNPPHEDFQPTWQHFYGQRHAENLGFSGDRTGNLLWRIDHGELDGISPRVAVILIGTNNTAAGQSADETAAGIEAVVAKTHDKLPATKILLLGILPSDLATPPGKSATDTAVNHALADTYRNSPFVTFLDIGHLFFKGDTLDASHFYDPTLPPIKGVKRGPLHPDTTGQHMMARAIEPTLACLFGDSPVPDTNPASQP